MLSAAPAKKIAGSCVG